MAIVLAIVLGILALAFVLYPLFRHTTALSEVSVLPSPLDGGTTAPTERELAARAALQEVELDFQLGNIAEADYRTLRERYLRRAMLAFKSRYESEQQLDERIEEQLRKLREQEKGKREQREQEKDENA